MENVVDFPCLVHSRIVLFFVLFLCCRAFVSDGRLQAVFKSFPAWWWSRTSIAPDRFQTKKECRFYCACDRANIFSPWQRDITWSSGENALVTDVSPIPECHVFFAFGFKISTNEAVIANSKTRRRQLLFELFYFVVQARVKTYKRAAET